MSALPFLYKLQDQPYNLTIQMSMTEWNIIEKQPKFIGNFLNLKRA